MCAICGGSGYRPAVRYGQGWGTGGDAVFWADHAVMEPCECRRWDWPDSPQPIYIALPDDLTPP